MILIHLLTVILAILSLAYCDDCNDPYPIFPRCNNDTLEQIKSFYKIAGIPKNVLEKASKLGPYMTLSTSYDYNPCNTTCIYLNFSKTGLNGTFAANGITDYVLRYAVKETHGVIRGTPANNKLPEFIFNAYPILFDDDIYVVYVCGNLKGSSNVSPSATILLTREGASKAKNDKSWINKRINSMGSLLTKWCFDLDRNYGLECFGKEPNETCCRD